jgi:hypothetical protein
VIRQGEGNEECLDLNKEEKRRKIK